MSVTLPPMTLQTLLHQYGVHSIKQLRVDLGISSQYAWNLWHAEQGIGALMMAKLHAIYHIPFEELMRVEPVAPPKPRGRPRKRRPSRPPEKEP